MSRDEYCVDAVNYVVYLEDSVLGGIVEQVDVGSDSCEDGICSTSLSPPPDKDYKVRVNATNTIGSSLPATFHSLICKFMTML